TRQRSRMLFAPPYPKAALSPSQNVVIVCSTPPFAGTYASTPSSSPFDGTEYLSSANRTFLAAALAIPRCTFILLPRIVTPGPGDSSHPASRAPARPAAAAAAGPSDPP